MGIKQSCTSPTGNDPEYTGKTNNEKMGIKQSCISPTDKDPKYTGKTNKEKMGIKRSCISPTEKDPKYTGITNKGKMGTKQSCTMPMDTDPKYTGKTNVKDLSSSPVQSQQVRDALFSTGSNFQVSQKTDGEVKRPEPISRHTVVHTLDYKSEDVSGDLHESTIPRSNTSTFETLCPRPENEGSRTKAAVKAKAEDLSGIDNKHAFLTNEDQKKKSNRMENTTFPPVETRDADNIKTAECNENHATSSSNDMNRDHENERKVKRLEVRVSQLSAEKDGLLNRLSEIGALKLTEHNPNVTDLGDPNRPEKVVEELSELYDNEWTDAYEHLTKTRKKDTELCAKKLLQILQDVFTVCMSSTEKKRNALRKAISNYVGLTEEDQDELDLKDIEKRIREYRRKKMQNNFKSIEKEVGKKLKKNLTKETFDDLSEYIGSCVRICWKLCTKEPPMHLDFGDSNQKMHFDKAIFMSYTKSGNYIDYVVWPAVYLYKDGPLMRKGVAQGIKEDKDEPDKPA